MVTNNGKYEIVLIQQILLSCFLQWQLQDYSTMDLLCVFFIYSHFDGCIIQSKAYEKSLLEMFLLCSIFKYGIFGAEESYMSA